MSNVMVKIDQVPFIDDEDERLTLEDLARREIRYEIVEKVGPAGGNPLVRLTGPEANVRAWLTDGGYLGDGHLTFEEYLVTN